ncbi:hypothetical protein FFLO_00846 [Filobasidium floriforme]|uniref:5-hydroxyisourate hydrolase n=1 Tax=Filobasidium floriforme TaxID=5210 RepID=A0A8K0JVK2_9TREE|nr:uncharacterized protein HD553DRAFT_309020 [Filobasidium floriforme]KAG7571173.1 hypothetical protein FFLO_00846 [Filobasidium floriforme]KAH8087012.1 hypothetical protein HD553DRAFT_309020 [Filobasidium floriforme]
MSKSPITCHVLDSTTGKPAAAVQVELFLMGGSAEFSSLAQGQTDNDGRCSTLLEPATKLASGIYKMKFGTGEYFKASSKPTFYPYVEIIFNYEDPSSHYHIPLLLSQFSYTTYRGS